MSQQLLSKVLENGGELVSNVRLAAGHLESQHRRRVEMRNRALEALMQDEKEETEEAYKEIEKNWPKPDAKGRVALMFTVGSKWGCETEH